MADPTNSELLLLTSQLIDKMRRRDEEEYALAFGTVGGGPNGDGTYPKTLMTGEVRFFKCSAQIAFEASKQKTIILTGSNNLTLVAAHNGCKVLVFNATNAINLTMGADLRPEFSCLIEQYSTGKIHLLPGASGALRPRLTGYEYTAGRYAVVGVSVDERNSGNINQINIYGDLTNVP
jgi:hypothetical protein